MNNWPRWFRIAVLKGQLEFERKGIRANAECAAGARTMPTFLRDLAGAIANQVPLTEGERTIVANILMEIAAGRDVLKALRIDPVKIGHRPRSLLRKQIAVEVCDRIDEGDEEGTAITGVAADLGIERRKVADDYRLNRSPNCEKG